MSMLSFLCDRAVFPLCASHALTKLGSKGWEFAVPLLLLRFSPDGSLLAPTIFGLAVFVFKFLVGPLAGRWMDHTDRMRVINIGIALQATGVVCALGVLGLLCLLVHPDPTGAADEGDEVAASTATPWVLIGMMVACGATEALGALISSVAVKKDWVPSIWAPTDPTLQSVNTAMANIDLVAEIFGPLAAGAALQVFGDRGGFVVVGLANVLTFGAELLLLRAVFLANAALSAPKTPPPPPAGSAGGGGGGGGGGGMRGKLGELLAAWPAFLSHPSGIPLLVASYALLYFTVLSPHGVVLTAYLQTRELEPPVLAAFRAAGALAGVAGMGAFRQLSPHLGLRRLATAHLWLLAVAVAAAAASFAATVDVDGLTPSMAAFLALVVVSRFGLYGFDLAVLQLQQIHVDELHRNSVGAVESSLCSLGTATLFVATLLASSSDASGFDGLVYASAGCVGAAALVYTFWLVCYHEHEHTHPLFADDAAESTEYVLFHSTSPIPGATHRHTSQQQRALEDSGEARTHVHLHFHPPWCDAHALDHLLGRSHSHSHAHAPMHPAAAP